MAITVSNITDRVKQDMRDVFASSGSTNVLIEYVDRIHAQILRRRRWDWGLSAPQRFITERGQQHYWIGSTASGIAVGEVDTGLNLTNVRRVKADSVKDRTSNRTLFRLDEAPLESAYQQKDASYLEGPPHQFRNDEARRNVLSLYPAPDAGSDYEVRAQAPHSTTATGGALAARTYYLRVTFVDLAGNESVSSSTARQFVEASKLLTVKAPQPLISGGSAGVTWLRYNVYASTVEGSETLQNVTPVATSADWTEDATGLTTTGAAAPTDSTLEPLRGYVIEFRYEKAHTRLTAGSDPLLVPDDYQDIVVAGVNALAASYKGKANDAAYWQQVFEIGMVEMTQNQAPWNERRFIAPDPSARWHGTGPGG